VRGAISVKQQLGKPTTERVLLAYLRAELRSHLSLLGNWQADQFTCIIHTPTLREAVIIDVKNVFYVFYFGHVF